MAQETDLSSPEARDAALRALVSGEGLTLEQVSAIKLDQVHLASSTLMIEPDEFASTGEADQEPIIVNLEGETQRAIIAWLVARPDGPNDHLFPGDDLGGLDAETIVRATTAEEPQSTADTFLSEERGGGLDMPPAADAVDVTNEPPPSSEGIPVEQPEAVSLDEIERLREQLAEADEGWSLVTEEAITPAAGAEMEPAPKTLPEPVSTGKKKPRRKPAARRGETVVARRPRQTPGGGPPEGLEPRAPSGAGRFSYRSLAVAAAVVVLACCPSATVAGVLAYRGGQIDSLLAAIVRPETQKPTGTAVSTESLPPAAATLTVAPTFPATEPPPPPDAPGAVPVAADTPTPAQPLPVETEATPAPVIVVVTATPTPEPPPTATRQPAGAPIGGETAEPSDTPTPAFVYEAPVLLEPSDEGVVSGVLNILKWESVGELADDEWYAVRLIYLQQGQPVYEGDLVKALDWRVPDRFFYQADGPALEYRWYVFVERQNADGSATQMSPESEEFSFRWE